MVRVWGSSLYEASPSPAPWNALGSQAPSEEAGVLVATEEGGSYPGEPGERENSGWSDGWDSHLLECRGLVRVVGEFQQGLWSVCAVLRGPQKSSGDTLKGELLS